MKKIFAFVILLSLFANQTTQADEIKEKQLQNLQKIKQKLQSSKPKTEEKLNKQSSKQIEDKQTIDKQTAKNEQQSDLFKEAYELHKNDEHKKALTKYQKVVKKDPGNALAWNNIGLIQQELGKDKEAERSYKKAIEIEPNEVQAVNNLAALKLKKGDILEAKALYHQAIQRDPDYPYSYSNLANVYKTYGNRFEAVEYYKKAIDKAPVAEFYYRLGLLYFEMERYEDMFETFQQAMKDNPKFPEVVYSMCLTHFYNLLDYPKEKQKELFTQTFKKLQELDQDLAASFQNKFMIQN